MFQYEIRGKSNQETFLSSLAADLLLICRSVQIQRALVQEKFPKIVGSQRRSEIQISVFDEGIAAIVGVPLELPLLETREEEEKTKRRNILHTKKFLKLLFFLW
jgi:hypothetical protein